MKRLVKTTVVLSATNVFLVTGGLIAFADWSTDSVPGAISATVVAMPQAGRPSVLPRAGSVTVRWRASFIRPGAQVTGYLVTRRNAGGDVHTVCRVSRTSCEDAALTAGTWSYAVQTVQGTRWLGEPGPGSRTVTVTASPAARAGTTSGAPTAGPPGSGPPTLGPPTLGPPVLGPPVLGPPSLGPPVLGPTPPAGTSAPTAPTTPVAPPPNPPVRQERGKPGASPARPTGRPTRPTPTPPGATGSGVEVPDGGRLTDSIPDVLRRPGAGG